MDTTPNFLEDEEAEDDRWEQTKDEAPDIIPNPYLIKEQQQLLLKNLENGSYQMPFVKKDEEHADSKIDLYTKYEEKSLNVPNKAEKIMLSENDVSSVTAESLLKETSTDCNGCIQEACTKTTVQEKYDCDLCSSSFATLKEIFAHQRTKHANVQEDPEGKVLKAADKGSEGIIIPSLNAEPASSHTLGSGFACDKCNIIFDSYSALVFHTGRLHSQCPGSVLEILPEECAADLSASAGEFQRQLSSPTGHTNIVVEVVKNEASVKVQCSSSLECSPVETNTQNLSFIPRTQSSCTFDRCSQRIKFHDVHPSVQLQDLDLVVAVDKENIKTHKTRKLQKKKAKRKKLDAETHTCKICNRSYSCLYNLERHKVKKHTFKCPNCPMQFNYPHRLRCHMGLKGPIKCDYCCASFGTNLSLKHHQVQLHKSMSSPLKRRRVTHKSSTIYKELAMGSEGELTDSVTSLKLRPRRSKSFTTSKRLERGSECRSVEQRHKCEKCDRIFLQKRWLTSHMSKTHRKKEASRKLKPRLECKECGKSITKRYMESHLNLHKPSGELSVWCTVCNLRFPRLDYLRDHLRRASRNAPVQCRNCCETFVSEKSLATHTKRRHIEHAHPTATR